MAQVQVKFITTQKEYAVPSKAILVPIHFDSKTLSETIVMLLGKPKDTHLSFDIYINQTLLTTSLESYFLHHTLSTESLVTLTYHVRTPPPTFQASFQTDDWLGCVKVVPSGVITGGYDGVLRQWTLEGKETGKWQLETLPWTTMATRQMDTHTHVFVGGVAHTIAEVQINDQGEFQHTRNLIGNNGSIESLVLHPENKLLTSACFDGTIQVYSLTSSNSTTSSRRLPKKFKPNTSTTTSSTQGPVPTLAPTSHCVGHLGPVSSLTYLSSTCLVSGGLQDHTLRTWDMTTCTPFTSLSCHQSVTTLTSLNPNTLVTGHMDHLGVYDVRCASMALHGNPMEAPGSFHRLSQSSSTSYVRALAPSPQNDRPQVAVVGTDLCAVYDVRQWTTPWWVLTPSVSTLQSSEKKKKNNPHHDTFLCIDWKDTWLVAGGQQGNLHVCCTSPLLGADHLSQDPQKDHTMDVASSMTNKYPTKRKELRQNDTDHEEVAFRLR